ncbi:MAG: DNA-directed RNA polymerase subunit omega [Candidatus Hydrogenedentota bacterium]|nr:MAG: DNA-directed RNA polymerase subunit omega [Candidatus Hydrogenedentota bacterium]
MKHYALEDFNDGEVEMDSLYRLVNIAARRANQIAKPENRPLIAIKSHKPIIIALEEIREGKVGYRIGDVEEDDYEIG